MTTPVASPPLPLASAPPAARDLLAAYPELGALLNRARVSPWGLPGVLLRSALVARLGADGAQMQAEVLADVWHPRPEWRRLAGLHAAAREHALSLRLIWAAGPVTLPGPSLAGRERAPGIVLQARTLFSACLPDVTVLAGSNLRLMGDMALIDVQPGEEERYPVVWEGDPAIRVRAGEQVLLDLPEATPRALPEAVDLAGLFSIGWGHSVTDFAPRLLMAESDPACPPDAPILVDAHAPGPHRDLLVALSGGRRPLIAVRRDQPLRVGRLWCAPSLEYTPALPRAGQRFAAAHCALPPAGAAAVLAQAPRLSLPGADGGLPWAGNPPRRLFLARKTGRVRQLAGQDAIAARFAARGFACIYPEDLPVAVQVALVQQATHVAGPAGSNLLLAHLFGAPGLHLGVLHAPELEETPVLAALAEARGLQVTIAPGQALAEDPLMPGNAPYAVDDATVSALIAAMKV